MPPARLRASLIYNPKAGRRRHARTIEGLCGALSTRYELSVSPTRGPGEAIELALRAAESGDAAVFAWGGDGTVREVVEGILGSPVALGVLPGGTFNVVARALGLPADPVAAAGQLASGASVERDVGLIASTPFLMQATAGLDGFLMKDLRADIKARFGMAGVLYEGVRAFSKYRFGSFTVEVDGKVHEVTGAGFVNLPEYAGRFHYVPGARWDDGQGQVLLYRGRTRLAAFRFAIDLALGRHHRRRDVTIVDATRMTIHAGSPVDVQTDGDFWPGVFPATCQLSPHRIRVLVPSG